MARSGKPAKPGMRNRAWRLRTLLALLIAAAVMLVAHWTHSFWIAELDRERIEDLTDGQIEPHLRALLLHSDPGLTALVKTLGHERVVVRRAAARVLKEKIDTLAGATDVEAHERLDALAALLAAHAVHLRGEGLRLAAGVAERIIVASRHESAPCTERLRNCHTVLAAQAHEHVSDKRDAAAFRTAGPQGIVPDRKNTEPASFPMAMDLALPLDGGALPIAPAAGELARLPDELVAEAKPLLAAAVTPQVDPVSTRVAASDEHNAPMLIPTQESEQSASLVAIDDAAASVHQTEINGAGKSPSAPTHDPRQNGKSARHVPGSLARLLALDDRLCSEDDDEAAGALEEIEELQIDDAWFKLARGAVDPDPVVRKELVEALSSVNGIETREWLLWLSYDTDAGVRQAAISLMATSNDPKLKKRVHEAAGSDANSRIRTQARAALDAHRPTATRASRNGN